MIKSAQMNLNFLWSEQDLLKALNVESACWQGNRIAMDNRNVLPGDLFIALKGPQNDGHQFVKDAFSKGALAAIVDHIPAEISPDKCCIVVKDTYQALLDMAKFARLRTHARIAAVTGSVGKTSVKEMLSLVLKDQAETFATPKSYNNLWGIPFSLAQLPENATYGVFEVGMNHTGEITPLSQQVRPDVALITNIEAVHMGNFASLEEIALAKAEIFSGMPPHGCVILNIDNAFYPILENQARKMGLERILSFGRAGKADFQLLSYERLTDGVGVKACLQGKNVDYFMPVFGQHWVLNSLAVLATVASLGANVEAAVAKLRDIEMPPGRGKQYKVIYKDGQIRVIDDSYNASPSSVRASLEVLSGLIPGKGGRRIAVLGDMYELGTEEEHFHRSLANDIIRLNIDLVYTCGPRMKWLFDALPGLKKGRHAEEPAEISALICQDLEAGDIISIKGSRGGGLHPRMFRIVQDLLNLSSNKKEFSLLNKGLK
ncbi:MAG: UDP-N-acetylmuramoyl-tripeptide--D-alanyl-D-alanine ligase [Alphaproteobacteria bacterium]|nr:UDP-N-acetylmuramoyl-tripeptide--D-alanyl-D-alanine ligase [Alphaproteobacteria bacterium]